VEHEAIIYSTYLAENFNQQGHLVVGF